ncbi:MAG: 50S ribosomal protein L18 [Saprospirales bacterium TMED214]|nr:MAG: 50S ribosomal protein L18 [Saprospirales bacterium TMED214]
MASTKISKRKRIRLGLRRKIKGTAERPRLSVFRSNKFIYAQLIDDLTGTTLASASSRELSGDGAKAGQSAEVGKAIAERAKKAGIDTVVFDRGGYQYHGRVKSLAEGAREGGLKF